MSEFFFINTTTNQVIIINSENFIKAWAIIKNLFPCDEIYTM